ncbi:MipA/OmpV family protein [Pseudomonadota bacterium]
MKLKQSLKTVYNKLFLFVIFTSLGLQVSYAQDLPKWEIGAGLATLHLPNYRGAKKTSSYAIPYPYVVYRGEKLNVDEDGIRTWIYKSDDLMLDISLAGGLPVASDENGPRLGMPDLDPTGEFGPSLEYRLWHSSYRHRNLWLRMPLRSAFSVGSRIKHQGWTFSPYLEYTYYDTEKKGWKSSLSVGPIFSDDAYHDYFYGVAPQYVTATRPAYQASSGYSGSRMTFVLSRKFKNLWVSGFVRMDSLHNTTFNDSPLVESSRYHIIGTALTYVFKRSNETVHVP